MVFIESAFSRNNMKLKGANSL